MSVSWEETSIKLQLRPWSNSATRDGLVAWSDIGNLIAEVFPVPVSRGSTQTSGFGIQLPGYPFMRADSMSIEPFVNNITNTAQATLTDFSTLNQYEKASVTITYTTPQYNFTDPQLNQPASLDPVPGLTHHWAISAEFLTIPPDGLTWKNNTTDPVPDSVLVGKMRPKIEHQITWPYVVGPPFAAMRACVGRINDAQLDFDTGTIAAKTLLFLGAELDRQIMSDGTRAWQVTYHFSEDQLGWNTFWNPVSLQYDTLLATGVETPYLTATFSSLFATAA